MGSGVEEPSSTTLSEPAIKPVALEKDLPCIACGTSLRGSVPHGTCAKCGTRVDESLNPELLRFGSRHLLRALVRGIALLLAGLIVYAVAIVFDVFVIDFRWAAPFKVHGLIFLIPAALVLTGSWRMTHGTESPSGGVRSRGRLPARVCLTIGMLVIAGDACWEGYTGDRWNDGVMTVAWTLSAVGAAALAAHLSDLLVRTAGASLAAQTRALGWTILCLAVLHAIGTAADPSLSHWLHNGRPESSYVETGLLSFYSLVGAGVAGVWAIVLLYRVFRVMRNERAILNRFRESSREVGQMALASLLVQDAK